MLEEVRPVLFNTPFKLTYFYILYYLQMKKLLIWGLSASYIIALSACNSHKNDMPAHSHEHHDAHEHVHSHHDNHHNSDGHDHSHDTEAEEDGDEISLSADKAAELGVKTQKIENTDFSEIIKVVGFCSASTSDFSVASAPSSGIVTFLPGISLGQYVNKGQVIARISGSGLAGGDANENARIALEIAKKELDRLTPLHNDGIVSTRDYNAALAEYQKAKAASGNSNAGSQVTARTSGVITELLASEGSFVDQGAAVATVTSNELLTIQADVPVRFYPSVKDVEDCNFTFAGLDSVYSLKSLCGRPITQKAARVTNGYMPIFFEIRSNGSILDGMPAEIYLKGKNRENITVVPLSSISEQQGIYYVYEKLDDDCYRKLPVKIGNNDGVQVEILSGLESGKEIVTEGTLFVKLAESSGVVPEGHSHTH